MDTDDGLMRCVLVWRLWVDRVLVPINRVALRGMLRLAKGREKPAQRLSHHGLGGGALNMCSVNVTRRFVVTPLSTLWCSVDSRSGFTVCTDTVFRFRLYKRNTLRQSVGEQLPVPNPLSCLFVTQQITRYRGVKTTTRHIDATHIGSATPLAQLLRSTTPPPSLSPPPLLAPSSRSSATFPHRPDVRLDRTLRIVEGWDKPWQDVSALYRYVCLQVTCWPHHSNARCARRRFHDHPPHLREADAAPRRH